MTFMFENELDLREALNMCEQLSAIGAQEAECAPGSPAEAARAQLNEFRIPFLAIEREFPRISQLVDRWGRGLVDAQKRIDSGNARLPSSGIGRWDTVIVETAPQQFAFVDPDFSELAGFKIGMNTNCEMPAEEISAWVANSPEAMAHHAAQMVLMRRINLNCKE